MSAQFRFPIQFLPQVHYDLWMNDCDVFHPWLQVINHNHNQKFRSFTNWSCECASDIPTLMAQRAGAHQPVHNQVKINSRKPRSSATMKIRINLPLKTSNSTNLPSEGVILFQHFNLICLCSIICHFFMYFYREEDQNRKKKKNIKDNFNCSDLSNRLKALSRFSIII